MDWIPETCFSCSEHTKYFKQIDFYWHTKTIITQVIDQHDTQHKAILDKVDYLDHKYEALVKAL
jgi:hypothetical protein